MRSLRYLNAMLTVLAVLLALQLWTIWTTATPDLAPAARAESRTPAAGGIPDAGAQRREMIDLLKRQVQQGQELAALLKSGQVRVRAEAPGRESDPGR